ncbi:Zn finger protein HypA/HybF involved in hydrogenase expression [Ureibacillus thermosphaericus]|uniref:Zn finger protein HypA/HybF involved in hydrogenase expression n=1 Tax=Ureibacillus thermosphaericus TaxID=51173 RepID=A0A840PVG7_URETH|nr:Zn finger protein HypA/HybF involved in hydrogenase expression [Ureibacillus thermosphaericus]
MLATIFLFILIIFIISFIVSLIVLVFKKRIPCPECQFKLKAVTDSVRCPKCKTKLYKQKDGSYISRN